MAHDRKTRTKLRVGDKVVVISGAHKGSTGEITRFNSDRSRVTVDGVNMVKRAEKPMPALGRTGGIIEKEASIHISNVSVMTEDGQPTRLGYRYLDNGEKIRVAKKSGETIEKARA